MDNRHSLGIDIGGVRAIVFTRCDRYRPILDRLAFDFSGTFRHLSGSSDVIIELVDDIGEKQKSRLIFDNAKVRIYGLGSDRRCQFKNGVAATSALKGGARIFKVWGERLESVHECAFKILHSALGECLDRKKLHRVHGLGFCMNGRSILMIGPSGVGKSSLAYLIMKKTNSTLYSDECPLVRNQTLHPFPLRMAPPRSLVAGRTLDGKELIEFPTHRAAQPNPVAYLVIASPSANKPILRSASRLKAFVALQRDMVVGIGLTQMAEWMLRLDQLPQLFSIAWRRFATAVKLAVFTPHIYQINLSPEPEENLNALTALFPSVNDCRIRSQWVQSALIHADLWTRKPKFRFVHRAVRRFYLGPVTMALQLVLRKASGVADLKLVPRHSVIDALEFNAFHSDLDYSIFFNDHTPFKKVKNVVSLYRKIRRLLPMLGELESYYTHQGDLMAALRSRNHNIFELVYLLRRWRWLCDRPVSHMGPYHSLKRSLSRDRCFRKIVGERPHSENELELEARISRAVQKKLHNLWSPHPSIDLSSLNPGFTSSYLEWTARLETEGQLGSSRTLLLDSWSLALLSALLPDSPGSPLRQIPEVRRAYTDLLTFEALACESIIHSEGFDDAHLNWMRHLYSQLVVEDPELARWLLPNIHSPATETEWVEESLPATSTSKVPRSSQLTLAP